MKKLYEKNELAAALLWIGIYVLVMNLALQVCGGFDHLAEKRPGQLLVPVICISLLAAAATAWIHRMGLGEKYGLCSFRGRWKDFVWFLPLMLMSCVNLKNGLALSAPVGVSVLMLLNMALGGYVEELIFRGFLFRAMAKDSMKTAVIVSGVTFGVGHIVNLANTADTLGVLLQVCYAIVIGILYTVIVYRGGSLWPCIASHMFVNGTSVFAPEAGPFTELVAELFGSASPVLTQLCSAVLMILIAGGYTLWLTRGSTSGKNKHRML